MPKQAQLALGDPYAPFEQGLSEDYPKHRFRPPHPAFVRKGSVIQGTRHRREYYVDLSIGECNCADGFAFRYWENRKSDKWAENKFCGHKLRMMARIIEESELTGDPRRALLQGYLKALGTRYNPFEAVSAFHKELRRGDFSAAWFWGLILTTKRGMRGLFQYMLNIIYEETRDHDLADFLLKCRTSDRMQTLASASKAISWFCATPKKWELTRRYAIFSSEMHGYKLLVKDYGKDVAKGANIIPADQKAKLLKYMQDGARKKDMIQFQRGLKGLQKMQYMDKLGPDEARNDRDGEKLAQHRFWIYEQLYALGEELHGDDHDMWRTVGVVNDFLASGLEQPIGYHHLNAIGDAIMGEPADSGLTEPAKLKRAVARPTPAIPLYKWPPIPLYAHDNHTYGGKALMRRVPDQLKPGAHQTDLDFRYCGAYFGVCYRMISQKDHGHVAEWHEVKWPTDLYNIVMSLWY